MTRGNAGELGVQRVTVVGERVVFADEIGQRELLNSRENIVISFRAKLPENDVNALGSSREDICPGADGGVPRKADAPVGDGDVLTARFFYLKRKRFFKPEMTGRGKSEFTPTLSLASAF